LTEQISILKTTFDIYFRYSYDIFEEVMAEIKKYAKAGRKPPPEPTPNAICFDLGGSKASHADVYYQLLELLILKDDCKIISLQYLAMSFRWKILLDSKASRDRIAGSENCPIPVSPKSFFFLINLLKSSTFLFISFDIEFNKDL
jgi:hypothetical protein